MKIPLSSDVQIPVLPKRSEPIAILKSMTHLMMTDKPTEENNI